MAPPDNRNAPQDTCTDIDLRVGSAESMAHLPDGSVDLTITSPPYWNARQYAKYRKGSRRHKERDYAIGYSTYEEYLALMTRCFAEVFRVTKPGGICCVNVCAVLYEGRMYPIPADLSSRLRSIGWLMREELVWDRARSACDRFGNFARRPYPHYFFPNLCTERVLVLAKPGPKAYKTVDPAVQETSRLPVSALAKSEICNDVWHIGAVQGGQLDHPAPFPQDLVARLILLYSHVGELVLDPFLGSGQAMIVAKGYGRRFVGVDVEERFVEYAKSRIDEPMAIRRMQLIPRFEHVEDDPFLVEPAKPFTGEHPCPPK